MFSRPNKPSKSNTPRKLRQNYRISPKGLALLAAVETGLLPEIEVDGVRGYDDVLFTRFWDCFMSKLDKRQSDTQHNRRD